MDYEHIEELINYIEGNNDYYYKLQASYGLNGWVLANKVLIE